MKINIRQIFYAEEQRPLLSRAFQPYDNSTFPDNTTWFEYGVIRRSFQEKWHKKAKYSGIVSWRFEEKTSISGNAFLSFIRNNPGYDVYFVNPFPSEEMICPNVWVQGEIAHPGMIKTVNTIFNKLNRKINVENIQMSPGQIAYSNYWVGNEKFWKKYMDFTSPVANLIANDPEIKSLAFRDASYRYNAPMIPFLMERLFSTLLCLDKNITAKKFEYPPRLLNKKYAETITLLCRRLEEQEMQYKQSGSYQLGYNLRHHPLRVIPLLIGYLLNSRTRVAEQKKQS
ncbi:MAG: hypothetical protein KF713_08555 [Turneriella sp.]|nr:hypothetical protein [Turneriella sp.]